MHKLTRNVKSALLVAAAVAPFLLAPDAAQATISLTQNFSVPVPDNPLNFVFLPFLNKFNPANGTLVDISLSLTGQFTWNATNNNDALVVALDGSNGFVTSQTFTSPSASTIPITLNLSETSTDAMNVFPPYIGTGTISLGVVQVTFFTTFPGDTLQPGADPLVGTLTYEYNPTAAVPEPSTWAMMLIGFAGLGFVAYRRKSLTAAAA
jgi:hypothetical protein